MRTRRRLGVVLDTEGSELGIPEPLGSAVVEVVARIDAALAESPSGDMKTDVAEQRQVRGK